MSLLNFFEKFTMYIPAHFAETRPQEMHRIMRTHPLGMLVTEAAEPRPWKMGDSAPEYINAMLGNIVGIEITITALQSKVKLSQNRKTRDRLGAADTLAERGKSAMEQAMRKAG